MPYQRATFVTCLSGYISGRAFSRAAEVLAITGSAFFPSETSPLLNS
jgi:hypothetical protein